MFECPQFFPGPFSSATLKLGLTRIVKSSTAQPREKGKALTVPPDSNVNVKLYVLLNIESRSGHRTGAASRRSKSPALC
ncbi:hypothetical protein NHX12_015338 [Muraenolepis orangiensis]|uniref:Uncharacterized protein n=1 Tax=Muraenolepis orangiensis TaxID=630683 RepID=A0A9Q0DA80_9TELE|nr:hypothetical protein NHX12_015338 [Muraenolepis orangiensis]